MVSTMKTPKMVDWQRLKKAVRYLVREPYLKRVFHEQPVEDYQVVALSDSDWAGDLRSRRSTTGTVVKTYGACERCHAKGGRTLIVRKRILWNVPCCNPS